MCVFVHRLFWLSFLSRAWDVYFSTPWCCAYYSLRREVRQSRGSEGGEGACLRVNDNDSICSRYLNSILCNSVPALAFLFIILRTLYLKYFQIIITTRGCLISQWRQGFPDARPDCPHHQSAGQQEDLISQNEEAQMHIDMSMSLPI